MPAFRPSYQDYLQFGQFGGGDGSGSTPGTEQWWNSLTSEQQFQLIGGNLYIHQGDPRYQGLADSTHTTSGSDMVVYGPQNTNFNGEFVTQNQVHTGDGVTVSPWDNHSPSAQQNNAHMPGWFALALAAMGGGFLASGGLAGLGAGEGAAGAAEGGAGAAGGGDALTTGLLSNIPEPTFNSMNLSGLESVMSGLGAGGGGMAPVTDLSVHAGPGDTLRNLFPGGGAGLNATRQGLGAANLLNSLTNGNGNNTRTQTMSGNNDLLSLLLGGGGAGGGGGGGGLGALLAMLALGRSGGLFGNGLGTPEGMMQAGQHAANLADPWGASGGRQHFMDMLTPEYVQSLLNPNPQDIQNNPEYQFQLHQGTNAVNIGDAAQGSLHSGNRLYELEQYGQGLATNFEQRNFMNNQLRLNQLEHLGGIDQSDPRAAGLAYMGAYQNSTSMQNNGLNGLLSQLMGGGGGGLLSLLGGAGGGLLSLLGGGISGISGLLSSLFGGGGGGGLSDAEIQSLISGLGGGNTSDSLFGGLGDVFGAGP